MPITVTPVETVSQASDPSTPKPSDRQGNIIYEGNIEKVDYKGRLAKTEGPPKQTAELAQSPTSPTPQEPSETQETKIDEASLRKEYIEVQKLKRQAKEYERKAKSNLERAEAFEKAKSSEDPTELLKAAGLDPVKYYQDLTTYALSDKGKQVETDPVKKELAEHKTRLEKYEETLANQERVLREREEISQHNQAISQHVIPLIQNNSDKYEVLLSHYGPNAATEVYSTAWKIYQDTGKVRSFQEVADEMNDFWIENIENGLKLASNLGRFKGRFAQTAQPTIEMKSENTVKRPSSETTPRSVTLSNSHTAAPSSTSWEPIPGSERMSKRQLINAVVSKMKK